MTVSAQDAMKTVYKMPFGYLALALREDDFWWKMCPCKGLFWLRRCAFFRNAWAEKLRNIAIACEIKNKALWQCD